MSDPIAAAEAAGKALDIANRFETAVFLIAYGIAGKDGLYEAGGDAGGARARKSTLRAFRSDMKALST